MILDTRVSIIETLEGDFDISPVTYEIRATAQRKTIAVIARFGLRSRGPDLQVGDMERPHHTKISRLGISDALAAFFYCPRRRQFGEKRYLAS